MAYDGIYRGIVKNNQDPEKRGRCRIYVPGIYPEIYIIEDNINLLPWAEPVMPIFGGSGRNEKYLKSFDGLYPKPDPEKYGEDVQDQSVIDESITYPKQLNRETGFCSTPHAGMNLPFEGAQVWLFFENGIPTDPRYFGVCQSGHGWLSEHENQHVIQTDNVRIRIDEQPALERIENEEEPHNIDTSCKFSTYNDKCTILSSANHMKTNVPARMDIEIWNDGGIGINLIIKGDVNMKVQGNVYEHIIGDRHETLEGNLYRKHVGDAQIVHEGNLHHTQNGHVINNIAFGDMVENIQGNVTQNIGGDYYSNINRNKLEHVENHKFIRTNITNTNKTGFSSIIKSLSYLKTESIKETINWCFGILHSFGRNLLTTKSDELNEVISKKDLDIVNNEGKLKIRSKNIIEIISDNSIVFNSLNSLLISAKRRLTITTDEFMNILSLKFMKISSDIIQLNAKQHILAYVGSTWRFIKEFLGFDDGFEWLGTDDDFKRPGGQEIPKPPNRDIEE